MWTTKKDVNVFMYIGIIDTSILARVAPTLPHLQLTWSIVNKKILDLDCYGYIYSGT